MSEHVSPANRRDFFKNLTAAAAAAPFVGLDKSSNAEPPKPEAPKEEPKVLEVDARMSWILQRFGAQLDDEARKTVRSEVESIVERSKQLRKLAVDNGDAPFPTFAPYRGPAA